MFTCYCTSRPADVTALRGRNLRADLIDRCLAEFSPSLEKWLRRFIAMPLAGRIAERAYSATRSRLLSWQERALADGSFSVSCPFSGQRVVSRVSLPIGNNNLVYEFATTEVFYVGFCGGVNGGMPFVMFPASSTLVVSSPISKGVVVKLEKEMEQLLADLQEFAT